MNLKSWVPNYSVPAWARRCRYYLMEFIASLIGLAVTAFLLDRVLFALAKYLNDAQATSSSYDQMNLWAVAMLLVWLPVGLLFYKRSRFEELERAAVAKTKLRRFFLYVFMLTMLLAAVGFAISAVYSVLLVLFGAAETGDTLLQQTVPAIIAVFIHGYVFRTFMKTNSALQIKEFAVVFGAVGVILLAALLLMTSLQARNGLVDQKTSQDLQAISEQVDDYYRENGKMPGGLNDLELEKSIENRGQKRHYSYQKRGSYGYKLCADFKANGQGSTDKYELLNAKRLIHPASQPADDFYQHGKGNQCFELSVGSGVSPLYDNMPLRGDTPESSTSELNSLLPGSSGF